MKKILAPGRTAQKAGDHFAIFLPSQRTAEYRFPSLAS